MPGRKPTPTGLHRLKGTFNPTRHGRDRAGEPVAEGELGGLGAPDWMSATQQELWRHAIAHAPRGILKHIDHGALVSWVLAADRERIAAVTQQRLDEGKDLPMLVRTGRGNLFGQSPYIGIIHRASLVKLRAAAELGFTPASRPRLATGGTIAPWDDPLTDDGDNAWDHLRLIPGGKNDG
jgi:phage terminase small subunit